MYPTADSTSRTSGRWHASASRWSAAGRSLTAPSGREGLALAASTKPDVILLDVMMPDLDGVGTFRLLQADEATRHIPVILLTAKVMAADRRQLAELGVTAVLAKPFDPLTLGSRIAEMLGWPAGAAA